MPDEPSILISSDTSCFNVKVIGRANFSVGPSLRGLARRIENENKEVQVNLSQCSGMDSTFMGILAMIALREKKSNRTVRIVNAGHTSKKLLNGLGLGKLFVYADDPSHENRKWQGLAKKEASTREKTETVLDAHKTLMDTDIANVEKFKDVVELVKKDLK